MYELVASAENISKFIVPPTRTSAESLCITPVTDGEDFSAFLFMCLQALSTLKGIKTIGDLRGNELAIPFLCLFPHTSKKIWYRNGPVIQLA